MGVPQVQSAEQPIEEAVFVVPGVEGWVEGELLHLGNIRRLNEEEEGGGGGGEGGGGEG